MTPQDFHLMSTLVRERSGLVLSEDKAYLLESRLTPITREHGMKSLDDLIDAIKTKRDEQLIGQVVEAMTTNESLYFRDTKPFDQLKDIVFPQLIESRAAAKRIRIWSAACSSGQEPHSVAMLIKESVPQLAGWNIEIVATDLSEEMLIRARSGIYSQFEVQRGLPITLLVKYFKQDGDRWEIDPEIRSMVVYKPFNLLDDPSTSRAAHSVYFQLMGDSGFVGLILYIILLIVAWQNAKFVISYSKRFPQLQWAGDLASMLQVSMVGFVVGGAALSMAYYDAFLTLLAILEVLCVIVVRNAETYLSGAEQPSRKDAWRRAPAQRA